MLIAERNENPRALDAVESAQRIDGCSGDALKPPFRRLDSGFRRQRKRHRLPDDDTVVVVPMRKLRYRQMSASVPTNVFFRLTARRPLLLAQEYAADLEKFQNAGRSYRVC